MIQMAFFFLFLFSLKSFKCCCPTLMSCLFPTFYIRHHHCSCEKIIYLHDVCFIKFTYVKRSTCKEGYEKGYIFMQKNFTPPDSYFPIVKSFTQVNDMIFITHLRKIRDGCKLLFLSNWSSIQIRSFQQNCGPDFDFFFVLSSFYCC